ncbi:acyl-CoA dehydrogenase family protein [Eisenibacter elegans]|jgi:alkylation response protein AidB-like acyl-CoA dehydrogenase|uniref:acyl-CoA dehydrogenase family protein n=1 Tax=Eisenibacter elegans TaxID=997 RepID=UPI000401BA62|nr:acyl-CoA dehydrogenase family protein [Eisenibacter elegans]
MSTQSLISLNKNQVLREDFRVSTNYFESDLPLRHFLQTRTSAEGYAHMQPKLQALGEAAAGEMNPLSLTADKQGPVLVKRDFYGRDTNEIQFHPAYDALKRIAVDSDMFRVKWEPSLRERFAPELHRLGFSTGFLYAMSESGLYCPLCMTDGVARLIDRYCSTEDKARLLPRIYTDKVEALFTGAMFLTEKAGGSDVGANIVRATPHQGDYYLLNGEKWFCSNANAEIIFALARPEGAAEGTRGLGIFLVEKQKPDGSKNEMNIIRLKDKLGVRSMASAECILTDTWGKLIGEEGQGFKIMTDMINLSRLYNAVAAMGGSRRALIEVYQFLKYRTTFGKSALEHALIREKMAELGTLHLMQFYLTWRAIEALDAADNGHEQEAELIRLLTPMVKKSTAEHSVYSIRESMELMGGIGYIEDGVMPKLMRDAMVLPIWEGAGNIMTLDMLRASLKSNGFGVMCAEIAALLPKAGVHEAVLAAQLQEIQAVAKELFRQPQEIIETTAKPLFERLTKLYAVVAMLRYEDSQSSVWIRIALEEAVTRYFTPSSLQPKAPRSVAEIDTLIGWEF